MRVAAVEVNYETNTFSPWPTGYQDFRILRGEAMLKGAFWDAWRRQDVQWLPTLSAVAPPQGRVAEDAYLRIKGEILESLERMRPADGVYLHWHGAMEVEGIGDGESDLAQAVRESVGPQVPIVGDLDLHGNIAPSFVEAANVLTALRTAPHRDAIDTQNRAMGHLVRCIREGMLPISVLIKVPLLLPGEFAVTDVEPARSLYSMLRDIEAAPGILDASLLIGFAWTDSPHACTSVIVAAEQDAALAWPHAARLARAVWEQREAFGPDVETASVEDSIQRAMVEPEGPVFVADSGDNVTAGAAGDTTGLLEALLAAGVTDAVVAGIRDEKAVARCAEAGTGRSLTLNIGGKHDPINGTPLEVTGEVVHLDPLENPTLAVLRVAGVDVILTAEWYPFWGLGQFGRTGMDPLERRIVVLKNGYMPPAMLKRAKRAIMALSPGFSDLQVEHLAYRHLRRPIFPLDRDFEWHPESGLQ